ncbi:MAG: hypothetical protein WC530_09540 [Candidatus Omnitrophota bacterium]|jgi:peptidoglycan hydrolase CwlO-like protein
MNHRLNAVILAIVIIVLAIGCTMKKAEAAEITGYERQIMTKYSRYTEAYALAIDGLQNQIKEMDKEMDARITSLSGENATLKVRIAQLEAGKTQTVTSYVPVASGNQSYADLEHRVHVLERVISMMEVKIGSFHSYINELVAPIKKALNIK